MKTSQLALFLQDREALVDLASRLRKDFGSQVVEVKLFGSKARGDALEDSDIDVIVVVRDDSWPLEHRIRKLGARLSLEHDVLFNLYVVSQERWTWMTEIRHPLYRSVASDGIPLAVT